MDKTHTTMLKEKVALLPDSPGVYQFFSNKGEIIYVGKAKNLKKRVSSYFNLNQNHSGKVRVMVGKISDIRHIVVDSEAEALLLENNMIKSLQPRYNILLKDDKTYPWIAIKNEPFSRVVSTRNMVKDGSRYFGPYSSVYAQKIILEMIHEIYSLRTCSLNLSQEAINKGKYRVCLKYHLGSCPGPCVGEQSEEEHHSAIEMVTEILKGNTKSTERYLFSKMDDASLQLHFEQAAQYKQRLDALEKFHNRSVVVSNFVSDLDIFSLVTDTDVAFCNYMKIVSGGVVNSFTIELKLGIVQQPEDILTYAIVRIQELLNDQLCRDVAVPFMPHKELFPNIHFSVPQRGDRQKLMELSERNGRLYRLEKLKQIEIKEPERHSDRIMNTMQKELYLNTEPRHIECFDNSNLQGTNPVAACVVFRNGKPTKKEYRHFNIKTVVGADDYASMDEVISRRYSRMVEQGDQLPDLIVVDGGKGQLSTAYQTLINLGLEKKIAIIGLAKRIEEVFFPHDSNPYYIDRNSETLKVLINIRNEAHRFGITFHRQKRSINFIKSELETIPNLGAKSIEKLLTHFGSVTRIKKATEAELTEIVGAKRAQSIINHYQKKR